LDPHTNYMLETTEQLSSISCHKSGIRQFVDTYIYIYVNRIVALARAAFRRLK